MKQFKLLHNYNDILNLIDSIDAEQYARSRNYIYGTVSHLSPYISRGVISLPFVRQCILQRYSSKQAEAFIFELAWREYFQKQWHGLNSDIMTDIKHEQPVSRKAIPTGITNACTGITAIDDAIKGLYNSMYMHNHLRMYVASVTCNIAQTHWYKPSQWMYYYLADHDIASNTLSWQWVAGTFSNKKYYCNQENINKYTGTTQTGTYLDKPYELLHHLPIPEPLSDVDPFNLSTVLPYTPLPELQSEKPLYIYNAYNLDPSWHQYEEGNRVLLPL